jgi:hypothetical protein
MKFSYDGLTYEISVPEGITPEQAQHDHLIRVHPDYRWLAFRRALLDSPEYPQALALSQTSVAALSAFSNLSQAIDFCCHGGADPPEVEAFQSALANYLAGLPTDDIGQAIASRLQTLTTKYEIRS